MIEVKETGDHGIVEVHMTSPVVEADYTETLIPAIDAAIEANERIRLLAVIEAGFSDFTLGAMFEDARTGFKHWRGFDRCAFVSDKTSLRRAVGGFSVFMPCPVATFDMSEIDDARRWLRESIGSIHQEDLGDDVLHIRLLGKLDTKAYDASFEDINTFISARKSVRLLIDLREFDGWQGLGALNDHFAFVRAHASKVSRAAVVGDAGWQGMAAQIGKRAFGIDAKQFSASDFDAAVFWLRNQKTD